LADNVNSEGGTNNVLFALGTSGTAALAVGNTALVAGGAMDGIGFATTGDGGIGSDYRVYPKSGTISAAGSGVYAANAVVTTDPFYTALFPAVAAPGAQTGIAAAEYPTYTSSPMAGTTQAGSFGFAWHKVVITKNGNQATWDIDNTRIATLDISAITMGGANIALGQSDVNGSTARLPSLLFTVFDNLVVESVPEPATGSLVGLCLAAAGLLGRRRAS
jgi:hypothetical protein